MKLYKVIDNQGTGFMGRHLWKAGQIRAHLYAQAKDQWETVPRWQDFTLEFCAEMWDLEFELQEDLKQ